MKNLLRNTALAIATNLAISIPAYAKDDIIILDFENNSVMSENVEGLSREIPNILENRLSDEFDVLNIQLESNELKEIRERFPGLDYVVSGSFSVINNQNMRISSKVKKIGTGQEETQYTEGNINELFSLVDDIVEEIKADLGGEQIPDYNPTFLFEGTNPKQEEPKVVEETPQKESHNGMFRRPEKREPTLPPEKGTAFSPLIKVAMPYGPEGFKDFYTTSYGFGIELRNKIKRYYYA